jgi:hypothetical protein
MQQVKLMAESKVGVERLLKIKVLACQSARM